MNCHVPYTEKSKPNCICKFYKGRIDYPVVNIFYIIIIILSAWKKSVLCCWPRLNMHKYWYSCPLRINKTARWVMEHTETHYIAE